MASSTLNSILAMCCRVC